MHLNITAFETRDKAGHLLVPIISCAEEGAVGGRSEGPREVAYWLVGWLVGWLVLMDRCVFLAWLLLDDLSVMGI